MRIGKISLGGDLPANNTTNDELHKYLFLKFRNLEARFTEMELDNKKLISYLQEMDVKLDILLARTDTGAKRNGPMY